MRPAYTLLPSVHLTAARHQGHGGALARRYGPGDDGQSISRYAGVSISSRLIFQASASPEAVGHPYR